MKQQQSIFRIMAVIAAIIAAFLVGWWSAMNVAEAPTVNRTSEEQVQEDSSGSEAEESPAQDDQQELSVMITSDEGVELSLVTPTQNQVITSPLMIEGEAPGTWYFEATFPIVLTDWDGVIIAEGYAEAQADWMTEDMVPFEAEISFASPYSDGDPAFMQNGTLILQKANASGLPQHDDAVSVPVLFTP